MDLDATLAGMWASLPVLMGCFKKTRWVCLTPGIFSSAETAHTTEGSTKCDSCSTKLFWPYDMLGSLLSHQVNRGLILHYFVPQS